MGQFKTLHQKLKILDFIINNNPVVTFVGKNESISFRQDEIKYIKNIIDIPIKNALKCEEIINKELNFGDLD